MRSKKSLSNPSTFPRFFSVGDSAIAVEFGDIIDIRVNNLVYSLAELISKDLNWIRDVVPTYRSLLILYDPLLIDHSQVTDYLESLTSKTVSRSEILSKPPRIYKLPVKYGGDFGPDLGTVAKKCGLSEGQVVNLHSGIDYRVFMLGFAPGFPYLGGMDDRLFCPRLKTPRLKVLAGSVGIAESQTGVYPNDSPGGWQIIGRTPISLFDANQDPPCLIQPGGYVRFVPITESEFTSIKNEIISGSYETVTERTGNLK